MATITRTYEIQAISPSVLTSLRATDDAGETRASQVNNEGGSPLRCCLRRADPGERVILVSYAPLRRWSSETGADPAAYDEVGPVFIHAAPCTGWIGEGLPLMDGRRVFRQYDATGAILGGRLVEPAADHERILGDLIESDERIATVHVRAVEFGCFLYEARVTADRRP